MLLYMMAVEMSPGLIKLHEMFSLARPSVNEDMENVRVDDNEAYSINDIIEFLEGKITKQSLLNKQPAKDDN